MNRIIVILLILISPVFIYGQKRAVISNLASFDESVFHFGFALGYNKANFRAEFNTANYSAAGDSLIGVNLEPQSGFNLGIVTSLNMTP
ncbi:MAG: hypothetical protein JKY54_01810, partial [Flavobacteriales bacterium]|nr:hypothetical protein [Flavobacteriales bacterium]